MYSFANILNMLKMYLFANIINMLYTQRIALTELPHVVKTQMRMCNSFYAAHQNGVQFEI